MVTLYFIPLRNATVWTKPGCCVVVFDSGVIVVKGNNDLRINAAKSRPKGWGPRHVDAI